MVIRLQGGIAVWKRTALDQCQPELGGRLDDLLCAVDVCDAGELHENLIVLGVARDDGSATPSSLTRRSIVWSACSTASRVSSCSASSVLTRKTRCTPPFRSRPSLMVSFGG